MMKRLLGIVFAAAVFLVARASPSSAQIFVVQTCGTVPAAMKTLVPGAPGMFFEDTTGTLCSYGSGGGGGGGGAVTVANGSDIAEGSTTDAPASTPTTSTAASTIALLKALTNAVTSAIPAGTNSIGTVQPGNTANTTPWLANPTSQYPNGATPITASATGTTAATTATLAGTTGKTTYICSYSIRANATANANVQNSITGLISGTRTDQMWIPANTAGLGVDEQIFTPCIPASASNTAIAVASGAPGTGGAVTVNAAGYQQ